MRYRMKRDTVCLQDRADAERLRDRVHLEDQMPVRKLARLSDAEAASWRDRDDPRLLEAIEAVWAFAVRTSPLRFPPGVHKSASIDDANRRARSWESLSIQDDRAKV